MGDSVADAAARRRRIGLAVALAATVLDLGRTSEARSLTDVLRQLTTFEGIQVAKQAPQVTRVGVVIEREVVRASDFPATATTPGFFYKFDESLIPERVSFAGGPIFVEPAYTVGAHAVDVSFNYEYSDFTQLDGTPLKATFDNAPDFGVETSNFALRLQAFTFSLTYGLTSRWDVNLLVPLLVTRLELRARSAIPEAHTSVDAKEEHSGVGDVLLRTKYDLAEFSGFEVASNLTLRAPSGDVANFQGLGDVVVTPLIAVTRLLGPCELSANLGLDLNADDGERHRARYGLGATCALVERLTAFGGMIGNSGLQADRFQERGVTGEVPRTDVVDGFVGMRVAVHRKVLLHVGVLVPATPDGLRADVVPTGGLEATW